MTNEEAIARIREHKIIHKMGEPRAIYISEALDIAIKALMREPCNNYISRQAAIEALIEWYGCEPSDIGAFENIIEKLPPVTPQPKIGHCKDCKWWKDSDGMYRRGGHAESQCPINRREVLEGNGYCYMYEPQ